MSIKIKEYLLKALVLGYAELTIESCDSKTEIWYKQCIQVNKYFKKRKPKPVSSNERKALDAKYKQLVALDATYFKDRHYSSYICMISLLDYLMSEMQDTETRLRFAHFDTKKIILELETTSFIKNVNLDTQKYITRVLDIIEGTSK